MEKDRKGEGRGDESLYSPTKQYWGECMLKQGSGGEGFLRRSKHLNNSDIFFGQTDRQTDRYCGS